MKTNDLSLITPAVITAAKPTSAANAPTQGSTVQFQATVISSQPPTSSNPQWQLTVSDGQRSLALNSDRPLPTGSQLTLTATVSATPEQPPQVRVTAIQLPAGTGLPQAAAGTPVPPVSAPVQAPANGVSERLQSAATQLRNRPGEAPAPLPQAVKDLLASRIRFSSLPAQDQTPARAPTANLTYASATQLKMSVIAGPGGSTPATQLTLMPETQSPAQTLPPLLSGAKTSSSPLPLLQLLSRQPQLLPAPVRAAIAEFISRLPTQDQLSTPAGVRSAVQNAPVSFERTLLQPPASSERPGDTIPTPTGTLFRQLWRPLNSSPSAQPTASVPPAEGTATAAGIAGLKSLIQQFARSAGALPSTTALATKLATTPTTTQESSPAFISTDIPLPAATGHNVKALLLHLLKHWPGADANGMTSVNPATVQAAVTGATGSPLNDGAPELFRLLQQAVSQIEHEQVRLLHAQEPTPTAVPLLWRQGEHPHQAQMNFADGHNSSAQQTQKRQRWQLTLHFDLLNLGPLDVELDLMPPSVSATFWSEQSPTLAALNGALQPLRKTLQELGAEVGELQARHGRRPLEDQPLVRHSLVDIHT